MNKVFIALGSNLGDRKQNLEMACRFIEERVGKIISRSHIYETEPWGYHEQPDFYNQVIVAETSANPGELMEILLTIEDRMGRKRIFKNGSRTIDLDILFFSDIHIQNNGVTIPHPFIEKRKFVLEPLNEVAPDLVHPVGGKTIREILSECNDNLQVKRIDDFG